MTNSWARTLAGESPIHSPAPGGGPPPHAVEAGQSNDGEPGHGRVNVAGDGQLEDEQRPIPVPPIQAKRLTDRLLWDHPTAGSRRGPHEIRPGQGRRKQVE